MVGAAGCKVNPAAGHALDDGVIRHNQLDNEVYVNAVGLHGVSLGDGSREAVEQIAVRAVRLLYAVLDEPDDDVIRDQAALVHDCLGSLSELSAGLYGCPEHVSGGNLGNGILLGQKLRLSSLSGAGSAQQNNLHLLCSQLLRKLLQNFPVKGVNCQ